MARLSRSDALHTEQFSYFLDQLNAIQDGDETLLDGPWSLFGSRHELRPQPRQRQSPYESSPAGKSLASGTASTSTQSADPWAATISIRRRHYTICSQAVEAEGPPDQSVLT